MRPPVRSCECLLLLLLLNPAPARGAADAAPNGAGAATEPDPAQWRMPARDFASTRYSPLDQVRTDNVAGLKLAWSFSLGVNRGEEAAPIVVNDTMYVA